MRIAIVCGCAEPGRDGVGDHSVRLASALADDANTVMVIALRDLAIDAPEPSRNERDGVDVLRIPGSAPESRRGTWLDSALREFRPDHVLLQFVCWGQADRGILDPLPRTIVAALARHRVTVYVHELWLGLQVGAGLRHRWWGRRQRVSIARFLEALGPASVITSNAVHVAVLERVGLRATVVPLLGNLRPCPEARDAARSRLASALGVRSVAHARDSLLVAVFGTVFPGWEPDAALDWLRRSAGSRGRAVVVVAFGRASTRGDAILDALESRLANAIAFARLGEVSAEIASGLLQLADLGMPTTGWELLGKSGVAATMRAHGLPLLVVRREPPLRGLPSLAVTHPPGVVRFEADAPPDFDELVAQRAPPRDDAPEVARVIVASLGRATHSLTSECREPSRSAT